MPGERVTTEEMHPDPPSRGNLGICATMVGLGVALIVVAVFFNETWGPLRVLLVLAGVVLVVLGFLLALGVTGFKINASADGIEASADMPTGYTRTMKVSESLIEGTAPPKQGVMPSKDGVMPSKEGKMPVKGVEDVTR